MSVLTDDNVGSCLCWFMSVLTPVLLLTHVCVKLMSAGQFFWVLFSSGWSLLFPYASLSWALPLCVWIFCKKIAVHG